MHVESQRRGTTVAPDFGRDHGVGGVIGPLPSVGFGHAQRQQAGAAQVVVVGKRKLRIAVELGGTRGKLVAAKLPGQGHQALLFVGEG